MVIITDAEPDIDLVFHRTGTADCSTPASSGSLFYSCPKVYIEIIIPDHEWKFLFKVPTNTLVRELLRRIFITCRLDTIEYVNYGLYLPPSGLQKGKFLQEERLLIEYPQLTSSTPNNFSDSLSGDQNEIEPFATLKLIRKCRFVEGLPISENKFKQLNSKAHQKQLLSAIRSHNIARMENLLDRGLDPNFQYSSTGETPLGCAASQRPSRDLILKLVEKGAHLEFRDTDTLTPIHRAAMTGNLDAIKVFLDLGQNPNVRDCRDLTPLYYAVSRDVPTECVSLLLYDHAILGVMDDKNRQEIHQACLFDNPGHLEQLILYGADLNAQTLNLDTPMHICALNNHESCLRILLKHGATRNVVNASGQTPSDVALLTGLNRLAEIIDSFTNDQIVYVSTIPAYNTDRRPSLIGPRAALEVGRCQPQIGSLDRIVNPSDRSRVPFRSHRTSEGSLFPNTVLGRTSVHPRTDSFELSRIHTLSPSEPEHTNSPLRSSLAKTVTLNRGNTGFGFRIRGQKDSISQVDLSKQPAYQYIDRVFPGCPAAEAGLLPGDYLLEVNGLDVRKSPHHYVTNLIVQAGSQVTLKVLASSSLRNDSESNNVLRIVDRRLSLSRRSGSADAHLPSTRKLSIVTTSNYRAASSSLDTKTTENSQKSRVMSKRIQLINSVSIHRDTGVMNQKAIPLNHANHHQLSRSSSRSSLSFPVSGEEDELLNVSNGRSFVTDSASNRSRVLLVRDGCTPVPPATDGTLRRPDDSVEPLRVFQENSSSYDKTYGNEIIRDFLFF
ncbi:SH3 and multiple ankyrin repeat domains protein 3 [Paragonimus heterotremus]|uniref:SH3 and multiple ankyrin repeat domains protein 3 n=1 Tax=Paragonimus heterotremus TaxID=100268 RepID=A0A8J4TRK0_9TREM|nr:SH3 and multiple ankyrin repeat domains protein 3 [Paragonimus heterotremus]